MGTTWLQGRLTIQLNKFLYLKAILTWTHEKLCEQAQESGLEKIKKVGRVREAVTACLRLVCISVSASVLMSSEWHHVVIVCPALLMVPTPLWSHVRDKIKDRGQDSAIMISTLCNHLQRVLQLIPPIFTLPHYCCNISGQFLWDLIWCKTVAKVKVVPSSIILLCNVRHCEVKQTVALWDWLDGAEVPFGTDPWKQNRKAVCKNVLKW